MVDAQATPTSLLHKPGFDRLLQQSGFDFSSNSYFDASPECVQLNTSLFPDMFSDVLAHSSFNLKAMQRKAKCCFYCKKPGHLIRSCRYKRRRDKLRSTLTSLSERPSSCNQLAQQQVEAPSSSHTKVSIPPSETTNQETMCCSLVSHTAQLNPDISISRCSENTNRAKTDIDHLVFKSNKVTQTHDDIPSMKLKKCNWKLNGLKSFSWCLSLSWLNNPFCLKRCKRELYWLISFFGLFDLFSFFQQKDGADKSPPMVAYCTIDSPQPLRGMYKLQTSSIQTWKRKKKKKQR